jgi:hypothetical protein
MFMNCSTVVILCFLLSVKCREKGPQSSNTASHDTSLPDLLLPELNPRSSVLHRTPPYLSPGYTFNPAGTEVKHRPCEYII